MAEDRLSSVFRMMKRGNSLCAALSGLILLFVTFSIFVDVILRYFFNRPSIWVTEVSTYLFLYIIFLGTAYALQQGLHINVTFFLDRFNEGAKHVISIMTSIMGMIFSFVLLWQTWVMTWVAFKEKWTSPTMLSAPYAYIYVVMVFGALTLLLTFLFQTLLQIKELKGGPKADTEPQG